MVRKMTQYGHQVKLVSLKIISDALAWAKVNAMPAEQLEETVQYLMRAEPKNDEAALIFYMLAKIITKSEIYPPDHNKQLSRFLKRIMSQWRGQDFDPAENMSGQGISYLYGAFSSTYMRLPIQMHGYLRERMLACDHIPANCASRILGYYAKTGDTLSQAVFEKLFHSLGTGDKKHRDKDMYHAAIIDAIHGRDMYVSKDINPKKLFQKIVGNETLRWDRGDALKAYRWFEGGNINVKRPSFSLSDESYRVMAQLSESGFDVFCDFNAKAHSYIGADATAISPKNNREIGIHFLTPRAHIETMGEKGVIALNGPCVFHQKIFERRNPDRAILGFSLLLAPHFDRASVASFVSAAAELPRGNAYGVNEQGILMPVYRFNFQIPRHS